MAGQYRFKDDNGNIVAQISASVGGAIAFSGSVVDFTQANNVILGNVQLAGTASNALLLDGFDSQAFAFTSSIHPFTASIAGTNAFTASILGTNTFTSSTNSRLNSIETISASNISRINSLETTSASVNTLNTTQNSRLDSLEFKTGSLASTGSNTFIGTQTVTGSLFVSANLIVQGTSSLQNITASAVSIGTNIVNLNTANPAIRYAGLVIGDSGSIGSSGSFLYDSVQDEMIFVHRGANTTVTSSVTLMGPQTFDNIGNETYLTANRITKGTGNEHLVDSNISDNGTLVTINSVTSSFTGLLGIGTTTPIRKLDIVATGEQLRLSYSGDNNAYTDFRNDSAGGLLVNTSAGYIIHYIAGSPIMRMNANGNVGIGITNPSEKLQVSGSISSIKGATDGGQIQLSNSGGGSLWYWAARTTGLNLGELGAADGRMFIANGGNVGIGITDPLYSLHVKNTNVYHVVAHQSSTNTANTSAYATFYALNDAGTTQVKGYFGVGGASVSNGNMQNAVYVGAQSNHILRFFTNDSAKVTIDTSGNVGIGITNPSYLLHVNGNVYANRYIGAITESGNGDGNAPFRFAADYSGWMSHVAGTPGSNDGWGIFWAGNNGAQYGTNQAGAAGNIWSNSTNPNEIAFVGGGNTVMSVHGNTGNVWIKGETRIASQLRVNGGTSTSPGAIFTSGGSSWSEGIWINPSPNNYAGVYFLTAADTPGDGMWFTGKVSNTVSGWEHAYGIFRRGYTSPIGGGTATFAIKQDGTAYFNENVINTKAYKANTFVQLSSIATKTFSWTGSPKGSFAVTDFSGVPSNAKAISVYGWYHITGYSGGAGQGDHAVCWFGLDNNTTITTWGSPNSYWPGDTNSFAGYYHGSFVMEHDGDASNVSGANGVNYYGSWHQGIITVNSNGSIYYTLGHGYSGGTHFAALYCTGYWI